MNAKGKAIAITGIVAVGIVCFLLAGTFRSKRSTTSPSTIEIGPGAKSLNVDSVSQAQMDMSGDYRAAWEIPNMEGCDDEAAAKVAEHRIRRMLKDPADANFASYDRSHVVRSDKQVSYTGYVDAPNTYGEKLRMDFTVTMECRSGGLVVLDVKTTK